ncbi:hypothetical protein PPYR_14135 [Photinus pyralis]|uniref:ATP synthase subunit s-like protein n=3 Tax=Photinus pyralis TaxID=7054 RepID=A0A5N4A4D0_PHOPY|nr:hypothetical protein PPYR_14135 [Photinus pyralis]
MSTSKDTDTSTDSNSKDLVKEVDIATKVARTKETTKKDLQYRTTWHAKEGYYYNFLRSFYSEESNASLLKLLQTPINLSPESVRKWWLRRKERENIFLQQYLPERNQTLGNELAAAHFIVYRGGAVKFYDDDVWIKANEYNQYSLPKFYDSERVLEAIDCTDMNLYYEGLVNLANLQRVEWFSVNGCQHLDDWSLDRITNIFSETLVYLDIRDCPRITVRGLCSLYKMRNLKILLVSELITPKAFELSCMLLQDILPDLDIRVD